MTKPTFYPEWATSDTTLPAAGTGNKTRPQETLRTVGWDKGQVPSAQEFNWLFDNVYDWVVHLDSVNTTNKTFTLTGGVTGSATYNNEAGWSVATTVTNDSHYHVSANISDATNTNVAGTIVKRDGSGNFTAGTITADLSGTASHATSADFATTSGSANTSRSTVATLTGIVRDGETIPLPIGYTEDQCSWFVSPGFLSDYWTDDIKTFTCTATGTRVITLNIEGNTDPRLYANYLIIGVK